MKDFHSKDIKHYYDRTYFLGGISKYNGQKIGVEGHEDFSKGKIYQKKIDCANMVNFKNKNVLDVGFGRGEVLKYCYENGANLCVGIDYSHHAWDIARQYVPNEIHIYEMAIDEVKYLPFDYKIDVVYIHDVLEHCPMNEWYCFFDQIENKLSNNVVVCASTPSTKSGPYLNLHNNYFNEDKIYDLFIKYFNNIYFCNYERWYYIIAEGIK